MYKCFLKRLLDILFSAIALMISSPLILLIAILVKIFMGGSVLFKQQRTGKNDKIFYIIKFKTMSDKRNEKGELLPDEQRRSRFGDILRSTSLDELPELWNIFVGDMSIIGPRPLYPSYLNFYKEEEKKRNLVRGGLVPPEVLSLNITPSWDEQLSIEAHYAQNISFWLDLKIFFCAFSILFKRIKYGYGEYDRRALYVERKETIKEPVEKVTI